MAAIPSLRHLGRRELEFLWLLAAGWDDANLEPARPAVRRLFLLDTVGDPLQRLAVGIGARAAGFQLLDVPAGLDADAVLSEIAPVAHVLAVSDDGGGYEALDRQDAVPVLAVRRLGGGPLTVLAHLSRWYRAGSPLRGLRVVVRDGSLATLTAWAEVTRHVPLQVTHVGERDVVATALLEELRAAGQRGEFRRLRSLPEHDVDATAAPDVRALACTVAAVLDFSLPQT